MAVLFLAACFGSQKPAPFSSYSVGQGAGSAGIHTVSGGETLWVISKRYNIGTRDIAVTNNLAPPFALRAGQRLKLPPPMQYRVRAGDSLPAVARLFAVSSSEIARLNDLAAPYRLQPGAVLRLPTVTQRTQPAVFAPVELTQAEPLLAAVPTPVMVESLPAPVSESVMLEPLTPAQPEDHIEVAGAANPIVPDSAPAKSADAKGADKGPPKIPPRAGTKFMQPVKGKVISEYGPKADGLYNDGINIKAAAGTPVKAADNGVVVYAGSQLKGFGNLILVRHADRWVTAYAHLGSMKVSKGDVVKRGQSIGTVGSTGSVDSPQLHFETRRGTEALNPQMFMES